MDRAAGDGRRGKRRQRLIVAATVCALGGAGAAAGQAVADASHGRASGRRGAPRHSQVPSRAGATQEPTHAAPPLSTAERSLRAHLLHELGVAGRLSGGYVYDLTTGQLLLSDRAGVEHPPASVEKLYTSTAALARMGASARLQTDADATKRLEAGVLHGNLYLRGGGDPTFGSATFIKSHYGGVGASVQELARSLVRAGLRRVTGAIVGDESYFDSRRGEPSSGYAPDPYLEGTLSGLAFNRGESGRFGGPHASAKQAALALREALRADGVSIHGGIRAGRTPRGAAVLARVLSPTLAQLLGLMLPPSDNFFAETLIKDLGARFAHAGTTAAGARIVREVIGSLVGVRPQIVDGSGLSRRDLTSPEQVVTLLSLPNAYPGALWWENAPE